MPPVYHSPSQRYHFFPVSLSFIVAQLVVCSSYLFGRSYHILLIHLHGFPLSIKRDVLVHISFEVVLKDGHLLLVVGHLSFQF